MKLSLGFSPCPNDCFMFDAIVNRRIDTEGLEFAVHLADVEQLNDAALAGQAQITKLSYHAYAHCVDRYVLLDAGSALGRNCGPLLISARRLSMDDVAAGGLRIAIPGKYTTANFLLGLAFPERATRPSCCFRRSNRRILRATSTPASSSTRTGSPTRRRARRRSSISASSGRARPARRFRSAALSSAGCCRTRSKPA